MSALEMTSLTHAQFLEGATPVFAQPKQEYSASADDILEEYIVSQMLGMEFGIEDEMPSTALLATLLIDDPEAMAEIGAESAADLAQALGNSALGAGGVIAGSDVSTSDAPWS